jgi:hypothetical protein
LEPNDTRVNAFPLTDTQAVTAQLSSAEDLDYYYYDNNSDTNRSGVTPIYFRCRSTSGIYVLSTFDTQGILQASYPIDSSQCNLPGGFTFNLSTPGTARYYVLVAGPADKSLDNTSSADYTISTFNNLAGDATDTFTGNLKRATIVDTVSAGNKDSFGVLLAQCGGKRGQVALAGNKLNLKGVDRNSQVQVKIGSWSCTSAAKALTEATSGNGARRLLLYPAPPAPTPSKRRGPQLSGGAG